MKTGKEIARATGVVSAMTLASRILGLVRDMAIATQFGAGLSTDAFFVAFKIPNLLRRLVAEGSLATAFVPVFTEAKTHSDDAARKAIGSVTAFTLLLTIALTVLGVWFAADITLTFAPGFGANSEKTHLATSLTRIMLPYIILVSALALASSILNSLGYFGLPAIAPAILNAVIILSILLFSSTANEPVYVLSIAVLVGGFIALVPQLLLLRKLGFSLHISSPFRSPAVQKLLRLMLPSVFSASVYQLMIFLNTMLASMLQEGSVTWLYYADRLFQFPLGIYSLAVATALLPTLSRLAAKGELEALGQQLVTTLSWISFITIPASAGLIFLSEPIVSSIYQHGEFLASDSTNTARALRAFSVGLWAVSCQSVLVRAFLSRKNTLLPSVVSCLSIFLNLLLAFALMGPAQTVPGAGFGNFIALLQNYLALFNLEYVGLALAGSIAAYFSVIILLLFRYKIAPNISLKTLALPLIKTLIATLAMCAILGFIMSLNLPSLATLLLGLPLGVISFFLAALTVKSPEALYILPLLSNFFNKKSIFHTKK